MEHRQAISALIAHAEAGGPRSPEVEAALAHVATCPICMARAEQLVAAIRLGDNDRLSCAESEELLPAFLAAQALGADQGPEWAELRAHLAACPNCSAALADLAELQAFADGELGLAPPAYPPPPRLAAPPASPPWGFDALGRMLVDLAAALLPQRPQPALTGLKGPAGPHTLAETTLGQAGSDLTLHLALIGAPEGEQRSLQVTVDIPSRGGWPNLGGSEVVLRRGESELARGATDPFGLVVFENLHNDELAGLSLLVQVAPEQEA